MLKILEINYCPLTEHWRAMGHSVLRILEPSRQGLQKDLGDFYLDFFADPMATRARVHQAILDFGPDVIVQGDTSTPLVFLDLHEFDIPWVWYAIDSHLHDWHKVYAMLPDLVWVAQKNLVVEFQELNPQSYWLPLSFRGDFPMNAWVPWSERKSQLSFVGKVDASLNPERFELLNSLKKQGLPLEVVAGNYVPVYSQSQAVLNQVAYNDLNYRFFEAVGCGAVLFQQNISHSLEDILIPNVDFLVWHSVNDIEALWKDLQNNPSLAEKMAWSAFSKIQNYHTSKHRASSSEFTLATVKHNAQSQEQIVDILNLLYTQLLSLNLYSGAFKEVLNTFIHKNSNTSNIGNTAASPFMLYALGIKAFDAEDYSQAVYYLKNAKTSARALEKPRIFMLALAMIYTEQFPIARMIVQNACASYPEDTQLRLLNEKLKI
jgi:hypothetical protein